MDDIAIATEKTMSPKKQPLGVLADIPPRRMDFEFNPQQTTRYYYDNDPFVSSFLTVLSSLFPAGEAFFVQSVRNYRDQITDPLMKAQVAGFIGQEAMHSKEHVQFNQAATDQGYPVDSLDRQVSALLKTVQKVTPKSFQLAATVCLEHYTALLTEMVLRDPDVQRRFAQDVAPLWLWHCLEETEHKSVAFDVLQKVSGNYFLRAGVMIPTTVVFWSVAFTFHARMLAADGQLLNLRQNWRGFMHIWGGRKGKFSRLIPEYLDFFKPGFHPTHHDTVELQNEWRRRLFGEQGLLSHRLKPVGKRNQQ